MKPSLDISISVSRFVYKSILPIGLMGLSLFATNAQSQEAELEEIVITGSLIPRQSFTQSSPVDVLDSSEIDVRAPVSVADFFADLPYVTGGSFQSGRAIGSTFGDGAVNLRGLGSDATLVMLNSKRQSQMPTNPDNVVDINSLLPEIMIGRVEVLKDGASALYGSDAIGGVVNMITRDDFEGVEFRARTGQWDYSGADNNRYELMFGAGNDTTHFVGAFSFYEQDGMFATDADTPQQEGIRSDAVNQTGGFPGGGWRFSSSTGSPGRFSVPTRDASGAIIPGGSVTNVDPECGNVAGSLAQGPNCRYYFWADNAVQSEIDRKQTFLRLSHDFSDSIRFVGETGFAKVKSAATFTMGDPSNGQLIPGHNPGNEFRAMDDGGNPLYAVSSGVSAGYSRVVDGVNQEIFLPQRDANGNVVLTATPTVAASGIPFFEDVIYSGRPIGSQGGLPTNNALALGEASANRPSITDNDIFRIAGTLTGDFNEVWSWQTGITFSNHAVTSNGTLGIAHQPNLTAALNGFGGPSCNQLSGTPGVGGCEYFNLFGNRTFATGANNPQANSPEIIDFVLPLYQDTFESELTVFEAIVTGELFEMPAGAVGVAMGFQRRDESLAADYDSTKNTAQTVQATALFDFDDSRVTDAYFAELRVPVFDTNIGNLELNAALRHERIGDETKTTDPKIGVLFNSANDVLTLRTSYSESFIAPSLFRLFATAGGGAAVDDCAIGFHPACTGEVNLRVSQQNVGKPDLEPQTSQALAASIEYRPIQDLSLSLEWWNFEFENQILEEGTAEVLAADPDGSLTGRVFRDGTGRLTRVDTTWFNAASTTTSGFDFGIDYNADLGDYGLLSSALNGSYVTKFEYVSEPGAPSADGLGMTNDGGGPEIPPNTKLRFNERLSWSKGPHSASLLLHYIGEIESTRVAGYVVDAFTPIDLSYKYRLDDPNWASFESATLSVGINNVFEETPDVIPFPAFQPFLASVHDLRGRMMWASVLVNF